MNKRIPTLLGLAFLGLALGVTALATQNIQKLSGRAAAGTTPKNIRVTNITESSFTVSYLTDAAVKGSAGIEGQTFFPDDRDETLAKARPYHTHYVTIKNLSPSTKYRYRVENGLTAYEITTASSIASSANSADPIFGTVTKADGTPAAGAIVYFSPFGGSPVSTYVKANGNFVLPVNNIRTTDLKTYLILKPGNPETIFIEGGKDGVSTISCSVGKDKPLPAVTLGQDANCGLPLSTTTTTLATVTIVSPVEKEELTTGLPTFRGKAPVDKRLQLEVQPASIAGSIKADGGGNWAWPVPKVLDPGNYTLTVSFLSADDLNESLRRNFSVKAVETQTAILPQTYGTPSAVLKPTPTPRPTILPKPVSKISPTPTPLPVPRPPVTGATENALLFLTAGVFLVTLGTGIIYKALWIR